MSENVDNIDLTEQEEKFEQISKYFDEIIKNKEMIIDMIKTNKLVYEEKNEANVKRLQELKDEVERINGEYKTVESKLKGEYVKYHEQYQKHDINFKLLERTCSYYKTLIKEREDEVRKFEEQIIYANQDYHNKKLRLDCLNVQIVEAEFQLKNLQTRIDDKMKKLQEEKKIQEKLEQEKAEAEKLVEEQSKSTYSYRQQKDNSSAQLYSTYNSGARDQSESITPYHEMEFDRNDMSSIATDKTLNKKKGNCSIF